MIADKVKGEGEKLADEDSWKKEDVDKIIH